MKVVPFYDRSDLIRLTTRTVEDNLLRGIVLVVVVLIFFLYDVRSGLIVAVTIPLSLLFAFICLDLRHIPANLLSIGAIDFGILVDGAVVMVENIYRQLARRHGTRVLASARSSPRPRPRWTGRSSTRSRSSSRGSCRSTCSRGRRAGCSGRWRTRRSSRSLGALVDDADACSRCSARSFLRGGVRERRNAVFEVDPRPRTRGPRLVPRARRAPRSLASVGAVRRVAAADRAASAPSSCPSSTRARSGSGRRCRTRSRSRSRRKIVPQVRAHPQQLPRGHRGRLRARAAGRRHRSHRILQRRVLRRAQALRRMERPLSQQGRADRRP